MQTILILMKSFVLRKNTTLLYWVSYLCDENWRIIVKITIFADNKNNFKCKIEKKNSKKLNKHTFLNFYRDFHYLDFFKTCISKKKVFNVISYTILWKPSPLPSFQFYLSYDELILPQWIATFIKSELLSIF